MKKYLNIILVLILVLSGLNLRSQTDTEFWFVKPNITQNHTNETFKIVFTTREFPADVTIEMPAEPGFTTVSFSIAAFTTYTHTVVQPSAVFTLMENSTIVDELSVLPGFQDNIGNKAILVTSTAPINAYLTQTANNNSDIYALKGNNGIGTEFIIPFQEHGFNQNDSYSERAFSAIDIISFEDGTVVEITPPAGKDVYRSGLLPNETNPFTVTIDKGEVYTLAPGWDPTVTRSNTANSGWWRVEGFEHLGGVIVKVLVGNGVAVVKKDDSVRQGLDVGASAGGWDEIGDQWVPYKGVVGENNDILGTEYVAMRGGLNNGWEWVYVAAPENNTRIWWGNGIDTIATPVPNVTINRGQQQGIQFNNGAFTNNYMEIISNKPLSVLHVSGVGQEMGGAVLPPIDKCTGSTSVSFARDINWPLYINIMARAGHEGAFLVDGVVRNDIINPAAFVPVGSSGDWVATQITYALNDFSDFAVGAVHTISNTEDVFHIGLINGNSSGGCRFGYFSDFNELRVSANTIQGDGVQPSSTIRACKGDTVQLYASGGSIFKWWPSTNLSSTTISNPKALVEDFQTYFVEVSGACDNKDTATVTIEMAQQPDAVLFAEKAQGCAPLQLEFRNLSTDVNQIYLDYNYTGIAGTLDRDTLKFHPSVITDVDSVFSHTFFNTSFEPVDSPEIYHVQLKVKSTKCVDTINTTITVYPQITADFTLTDLDDTLSCNPAIVDFQASALSINEDFYKWSFGDGALSADPNPTHEYNNILLDDDTAYTAQLVVRSDWFCRDTTTMDFVVHPYLEGGFTIDEDQDCSPFNVLITDISAGADTIFLDFGDGTDTVMTSFNFINHLYENNDGVDEVDTNIIVMRVKNDEGCEFIDRDTIIVYPEVHANYTIDGNSYIGCNSRDVQFDNLSNYGTHLASEFIWTFGDGTNSNSTATPINHSYINSSVGDFSGTIKLRAESIYGCWDDTTHQIDIYKALADFYVDTTDGCSPVLVNVINNSVGTGIDTWTWEYGDGNSSNLENPPTYIYSNNGFATAFYDLVLEVEHSNGLCTSTDTVNMSIYPEVNIVAITPLNQTICDSTVLDFTSTISNAALPIVNYDWNFGDGASSSLKDPSHLYRNLGSASQVTYNISLDVETDKGCSDNINTSVFVGNFVNAAFSINKSEGCSPVNVQITNNSKGGEYRWYWDSATAAGAEDQNSTDSIEVFSHQFVNNSGVDKTFYLTLVVENADGCTDTLTREILVHSSVTAEFVSLSGLADCTPFTVNFDNQTDPTSDAETFTWNFDDGITGNTTKLSPDIAHTFENNQIFNELYTVRLYAESPHGCVHDTTLDITVYSKVVADFSITDSEGCPPFNTTIINTSTGNGANSYEWLVNNAAVASPVDKSNFNHTYDNANHLAIEKYEIKLTAENPEGCPSVHIDTVSVYEFVNAAFNMDVDQGCNPLSVVFSDASLVPALTKYNWDFGDGATSGSANTANVFYNPSRISDLVYDIELIIQSPNYCYDTISDQVTVFHKPLSKFFIDQTSSCPDLEANMNNNESKGYDSFEWRFGDGNTNTVNTSLSYTYPNTLIDTVQNYILEHWVGTVHGCTDSSSLTLNVFPSVIADFNISDADGCSPHVATFDASVSSKPAQYFTWDFDDGGASNDISPTHRFDNTWTTDRVYKIFLKAYSEYDCEDTISKFITVYAQPIAEFDANPIVQKYPESQVNIDNKSNSGNWNYLWTFGDTETSTLKEPNFHVYDHWGEYQIDLVTSSPTSVCTDNANRIVTILPPEVNADFDMDVSVGCEPLEVQFTAKSSVYAEDYSYEWDFGDGEEYTGVNPVHIFTAGSYNIKLTAISNEGAGEDYEYKTVKVYSNPKASFEVLPNVSMIDAATKQARVEFYNLSECNDTAGCSYLWSFGDGETSISRDVTHQYVDLGKYDIELKVTSAHGCKDSLKLVEEVEIIGAGEIEFPNAFTPHVTLGTNDVFRPVSEGVIQYELWIYNRWGELIFTTKDLSAGWDGTINGDMAKPDVYVWKAKGKFTNGQAFEIAGDVTLIR
jgi:gliding motility-associated-like protein